MLAAIYTVRCMRGWVVGPMTSPVKTSKCMLTGDVLITAQVNAIMCVLVKVVVSPHESKIESNLR